MCTGRQDRWTHTRTRCTSDTQRHRDTDTKEMAWSQGDIDLEGPRMASRCAAEVPTGASLLLWLERVGTVSAALLSWLHKRWSWSQSVSLKWLQSCALRRLLVPQGSGVPMHTCTENSLCVCLLLSPPPLEDRTLSPLGLEGAPSFMGCAL